jgi:hypothetical protein
VHRPDELRVLRVVAAGGAELGHEPRQRRFRDEGVRPQDGPDLRLGQRVGTAGQQQAQQLECLGLERHGLPRPKKLPALLVEGEVPEGDRHLYLTAIGATTR